MIKRHVYEIVVLEHENGSATACLYDETSPLRGFGESPLQAIRMLCETIREWPITGADQWMGSADSNKLRSTFGVKPAPDKKVIA